MAKKNLYHGVNAHLMSFYQNERGYKSFHAAFVSKLTFYLNRFLPEQYRAVPEDTLQILRTLGNGRLALKTLSPDVAVRETDSGKKSIHPSGAAMPDLYVPLPAVQENKEPLSVVIYEQRREKPVTVIEVLSPGNKIGTEKRAEYQEKRYLITRAGVALVEIDLLHETPSVIEGLPPYPDDLSATPYYIAVTDPRTHDQTAIYRFGIDQPMPTLHIPLLSDEFIPCDFNQVYQETFEEGRFGEEVEYQHDPPHMNTYSPPDQQKIREVMARAN